MGAGVLVVVWKIAADRADPIVLPGPVETVAAGRRLLSEGRLLGAAVETLVRFGAGVLLGGLVGLATGTMAGLNRVTRELLRPAHGALLGTPPIVILVVASVWLGTGGWVPITVVTALTVPFVHQATMDGIVGVEADLVEMARAFRLPRTHVVRHLLAPALASPLLTALSLVAGNGVRITIMAELLAASTGMGSELALARSNLDTAAVFALAILAVALVLVVDRAVIEPLRRRARRWQPVR